MQKLLDGIHQFQKTVFGTQRALFEHLADKQNPQALFITCSDSRINPNLVTQTNPGDLFILRNVGNVVPPYGATHNGGEAAAIEFALCALGVRDIILCGHSSCGAMKGLLKPESLRDMPSVAGWLAHAEATRRIIRENYQESDEKTLLTITVEENILVQLENLKTHPAVAARLASGRLSLHGWYYKIESGEVFTFNPDFGQFVSVKPGSHPDDDDVPDITRR